jgi:glucose 1-dehydrogenase
VNISSVHEDMVFPHFQSYCAAKGALRMLMRDLAVELGPLGITVNNVAPGAIDTPINSKMEADPKELDGLLANIPLGGWASLKKSPDWWHFWRPTTQRTLLARPM